MVGKFIIKSGELIPIEKATMSLGNIEYAYGFGVYETIKLQNDIIYFAKDHVERLIKSAEQIGLVHRFIASKLLEELNLRKVNEFSASKKIIPDTKEEAEILKYLTYEPIHVDILTKKTNLTAQSINSTLTLMEMKGKVKNLGGLQYVLAY